MPTEDQGSENSGFSFEVEDFVATDAWWRWRRFSDTDRPRYRRRNGLLRLSGAVDDCPCQVIPDLCASHAECSLLTEWVRSRDWREAAVEALAELRGWSTLYGPHGRRTRLEEKLPEGPNSRGAPRAVFFGERHAKRARTFLDHTRDTGPDHVRDTLQHYTVADMEGGDVRVPPVWVEFPDASFSRPITELLEEVDQLSSGRYRYRRERLADRLLAEVAGTTPRAVRYSRDAKHDSALEVWISANQVQKLASAVRRRELLKRDPESFERMKEKEELSRELSVVLGGTTVEKKEWICERFDVLHGELLQNWIRPLQDEHGLTESEAVDEILAEKVGPAIIGGRDRQDG